MKRSLWLANVYKWVIRKLKEKKYTRFTGFGDGTGKSINHMGARDDFWPFRHFEHLQLSLLPQPLLGIFDSFFVWVCSPLEESSLGFRDASAASRSVSRHTWERGCCLSWQLLRCPRGPDWLSNLSSWKSQPDGGRDEPASGNLTTCPPALSLLLLLPPGGSPPPSSPECSRGNYIGQRVG